MEKEQWMRLPFSLDMEPYGIPSINVWDITASPTDD